MVVLSVEGIKIASINQKFLKRRDGRLFLNPAYRQFKNDLTICCRAVKIAPPYAVSIRIRTATDVDAPIKPILDALQAKGVIEDDKHILSLRVMKTPIQRGKHGSVEVIVETMEVGA